MPEKPKDQKEQSADEKIEQIENAKPLLTRGRGKTVNGKGIE